MAFALVLFFTSVAYVDFIQIELRLARSGLWGPFLFAGLMILGVVFSPIPTSPLTVMSARLFGFWGGMLLTLVSATIGGTIAFLIARRFGERVSQRSPRFREWRSRLPVDVTAFAIFLMRLPPSPTFDLVSYAAGLTRIPVSSFMIATFFGMTPVVAALCLAGQLVPTVWLAPLLAGLVVLPLLLARGRKGPSRR